MRDPETGASKGYGFVSYDSFEASDNAFNAMNGQYFCNRTIHVSYAYKKDTKGERHGSAAERLLAANRPMNSRTGAIFSGYPSALDKPDYNNSQSLQVPNMQNPGQFGMKQAFQVPQQNYMPTQMPQSMPMMNPGGGMMGKFPPPNMPPMMNKGVPTNMPPLPNLPNFGQGGMGLPQNY